MWAHPRECGADSQSLKFMPLTLGSSPRVRGRQNYALLAVMALGLIPASAGQTVWSLITR